MNKWNNFLPAVDIFPTKTSKERGEKERERERERDRKRDVCVFVCMNEIDCVRESV